MHDYAPARQIETALWPQIYVDDLAANGEQSLFLGGTLACDPIILDLSWPMLMDATA